MITELSVEALPFICRVTSGYKDSCPVKSIILTSPPAIFKNGLTVSNTSSIPSSVKSGAPGITYSITAISGICSFKALSMPIVIVVVDDGQEPQAPSNSSLTIGPSIPTSFTLPPSFIKYGLTSSSTFSTFSVVRTNVPFAFLLYVNIEGSPMYS
jgi:hypothetical protein